MNLKQKLFAQIIRDADKIDIFYESVEMFWKGRESLVEESTISVEVFKQFLDNTQVKAENKKTPIDDVIAIMAFIFDINFKISFQILKEQDYVNKTLNRYDMYDFKTKEKLEEIRKIANLYIEQKIK